MDIISKKVLSQLVITNMSHCSEVLGQTMPRECTTSVSPSTFTSVSTLLSTVVKAHRAPALCTHITFLRRKVSPQTERLQSLAGLLQAGEVDTLVFRLRTTDRECSQPNLALALGSHLPSQFGGAPTLPWGGQ